MPRMIVAVYPQSLHSTGAGCHLNGDSGLLWCFGALVAVTCQSYSPAHTRGLSQEKAKRREEGGEGKAGASAVGI